MASTGLSYQRLPKLPGASDEEDTTGPVVVSRSRSRGWLRIRRASGRWRRPRLRIPGLRRLLRRKARAVGAAVGKVLKRLNEGRPLMRDLFAGNYMFMQVTPSPTMITSFEKSFLASYKQYYHHLQVLHQHQQHDAISSSMPTCTVPSRPVTQLLAPQQL